MKTYRLAHNLGLIDIAPPISGFKEFISIYVLEAEKIALVDVGPSVSVENLVSGLGELGINPADISYIFVTHVHIDHAGGVGKAIEQMPNARVIVHKKGRPHLIDPTRLWEDSKRALGQYALEYQSIGPVSQDRIIIADGGMLFNLGGTEIEVLDTPGHAPHNLSFLDKGEGRLFVGDTAGIYIEEIDLVRPATPPPFDLEQALTSLDELMSLHPTSLCYAHFGSTTHALDKLQSYKKQLLLWGNIIADCLEREINCQDIYDEIRREDTALVRLDGLPTDQRDRELYFINSSIMGFVDYFKRHGTGYIRTALASKACKACS
ncbi:MBL fold metallo-hydrolase [Chloroflexota bacterium]